MIFNPKSETELEISIFKPQPADIIEKVMSGEIKKEDLPTPEILATIKFILRRLQPWLVEHIISANADPNTGVVDPTKNYGRWSSMAHDFVFFGVTGWESPVPDGVRTLEHARLQPKFETYTVGTKKVTRIDPDSWPFLSDQIVYEISNEVRRISSLEREQKKSSTEHSSLEHSPPGDSTPNP